MRHIWLSFALFFATILPATAKWVKIQDADYIWGPFKIYNVALFTETGESAPNERPLMLQFKYAKPVDGRDFAISLARSWSNLGINLPNQEEAIDRLRKILPDIKVGDQLSYIALPDKGYFLLNDYVVPAEFNGDFNHAVVAVWLDPRVDIGKKLLAYSTNAPAQPNENAPAFNPIAPLPEALLAEEKAAETETAPVNATEQAVNSAENLATTEKIATPPEAKRHTTHHNLKRQKWQQKTLKR